MMKPVVDRGAFAVTNFQGAADADRNDMIVELRGLRMELIEGLRRNNDAHNQILLKLAER